MTLCYSTGMGNYPNPGQLQPPPGGFGGGPGYPQPGPIQPKSGMGTGAIIAVVIGVVVLVLVGIIGILAVLGIYGTRKYIANAKTAEARNGLGMMAKDAATAYEREQIGAEVLNVGATATVVRRLCPSARSPVPSSIAAISGKKYQSSSSEWESDPGWSCLRFEMNMPQYYQYNYASTASSFTGTAKGDLNGDGVASTFEIEGEVQNGSLRLSPTIKETSPEE
jgi:type IV pilus assembly protein PilA